MRSLALLLIFQTLMVPVLPWSMTACIDAFEACTAQGMGCMDSCCMSTCSASACSTSSCSTPENGNNDAPEPANDEEQCPWCPFLACTYGIVPMPTSPMELGVVVPSTLRAYAILNSDLLEPVLDEAWHPPEMG